MSQEHDELENWAKSLHPQILERKAEAAAIRELLGDRIPKIRQGSAKQLSWATDIATAYVSRMPEWVWELTREQVEGCRAGRLFETATFWIDGRDLEFYGFLLYVLSCAVKVGDRRTPFPARLLALLMYCGPAGTSASSPRIDALLGDHPVEQDGLFTFNIPRWDLKTWGHIAADGLREIDPEATAFAWSDGAAADTPEPVHSAGEMELELLEPSPAAPVVVLRADHTWVKVVAAQYCSEHRRYHTKVMAGSRVTAMDIDPHEIVACLRLD